MSKVFIGVGHGGSDAGAVANGLKEKDINLVIGAMLKVELERHGVTVGISRKTDENDPLAEAIKEANGFNADVAIDIHTNAGGGKGFEVYQQQTIGKPAQSLRLAQIIEKRVLEMGQSSRGIKGERAPTGNFIFGWLREVKTAAILTECAFIDNAQDVQLINTITKQEVFGVAYAKAVLEYFGIEWKPAQSEKEAQTILYSVMQQVIALSSEESARKYAAEMNKLHPDEYWFITEK